MTKKQVKVPVEKLHDFTVKQSYLNFVLSNRTVILAQTVSVESDSLKIKNSKGHVLHLPLNQIEEIWAEEKVC